MYPEKTLSLISDMGFSGIEVFLNSNSEFSMDYIRQFKSSCDGLGLQVMSVHPFTAFAEPQFFFSNYDRRFTEGLELYKKYFSSAAYLGATYFLSLIHI